MIQNYFENLDDLWLLYARKKAQYHLTSSLMFVVKELVGHGRDRRHMSW